MTIAAQIKASLRQARLDKDERTKNVIGMLKAKLTNELKSGKGLEENDELWFAVLNSYAKEVGKAMDKYRELGERGAEPLADAQFELDYCQRYLPTKLDEGQTEALVRALAAEHGITDPKQGGRLVGLIMKSHKDEVDGNLARQIAQRVLAES